MLCSAVFFFFERGEVNPKWRTSVTVAGLVTFIAFFHYYFMRDAWGGAFTEGSAWHYTWSVLHDPKGLMNLMGGRDSFIKRLDEVFTAAPTSAYSYYGFKIHEILELELVNMGQYAHGNQPIQHAIYFYNYAQQPWKTQEKIR